MFISYSDEEVRKAPGYDVVKIREDDWEGGGDGSNSSYYCGPVIWVA